MTDSKEKIEKMIQNIKEHYDPDRVQDTVREIKTIILVKRLNYIELISVISELKELAKKIAEQELQRIKNQTQNMSETRDVRE